MTTEQNIPATNGAYEPVEISIKSLLQAGAHFGHKTDRWNPKMAPFIFTEKNRVHVLNLDITMELWQQARDFIVNSIGNGGTGLFVGTKLQARQLISESATRCDSFYVCNRWLGGTLSNFQTVKNSIKKMEQLEALLNKANEADSKVRLGKKEKLDISRQIERLERNIGGIRKMKKQPSFMFIIDINKEDIALAEARKLGIPIVALVDTNVDPTKVDFPIPSNDDATRTIALFTNAIADAILEGQERAKTRVIAQAETKGGSKIQGEEAAGMN
jgi:small subunit ribosomal protein S2